MIPLRVLLSVFCIAMFLTALSVDSEAGAVRPGFNSTADGRNDDGTWTAPAGCTNAANGGTCAGTAVPLGFSANFFGVPFTSAFVNTNGNITFDARLSTFTPFGLTATSRQIIAPFFADVDTRNAGSNVVTFGNGTVDGHTAFGVNWVDVGYFDSHADKLNSFQLILIDRSDIGQGDFDIEFNYDRITWETGDASDGEGGLGGSSARAGFSNGTGAPGSFFEFPGSGVPGSLLDSNQATGLINHSLNSDVLGRYDFFARNGEIVIPTPTPEPSALVLIGSALTGLVLMRRRRRR
jgi:hypothetical protein